MTSEMCIAKAIHDELRRPCEDIVAAQRREIAQMQSWLQHWCDITCEPDMKPGAMKQMEKHAALDGAEFEIAFMEVMIKHDAKAVQEGAHRVERAYHDELQDLCKNIVETQTAEIELRNNERGTLATWPRPS